MLCTHVRISYVLNFYLLTYYWYTLMFARQINNATGALCGPTHPQWNTSLCIALRQSVSTGFSLRCTFFPQKVDDLF